MHNGARLNLGTKMFPGNLNQVCNWAAFYAARLQVTFRTRIYHCNINSNGQARLFLQLSSHKHQQLSSHKCQQLSSHKRQQLSSQNSRCRSFAWAEPAIHYGVHAATRPHPGARLPYKHAGWPGLLARPAPCFCCLRVSALMQRA